jgi:tRNA-specific 2-thiouridylase
LEHALFPIGHLHKSEVREIARKAGLPNAERKDSQGLCFVGKVNFSDFLKTHIPSQK